MRRFVLNRKVDVSGVSGTGRIAEGVEWSCGKVSICWLGTYSSSAQFDNLHQLQHLHGHGGTTTVEWLDPDEFPGDPYLDSAGDCPF